MTHVLFAAWYGEHEETQTKSITGKGTTNEKESCERLCQDERCGENGSHTHGYESVQDLDI